MPRTDVLKNISFGDVEEIPFTGCRTIESYNRTHKMFDFSKVRFHVQISDIKSKYVTMLLHIDIDASYLHDTQKSFLPLLIDLWPGFDITTIEYSSIKIKAECKLEKLPEEIESLRDIINYKNFTVNEVNETVVKIINKKPPEAESILSAIEDNLYFDNRSLRYFSGYLV